MSVLDPGFPEQGGTNLICGSSNILFWSNFPENCIKIIKCGPREGAWSLLITPLGSVSACENLNCFFHFQLYRPLNIYVALVGIEIWTANDKISVENNADTTMNNFLEYRREHINYRHRNDNSQLIT